MASTESAIDRILYIIGRSDTYQATPNTITGNPTEVYSYGLRIAHKTPIGWYVIPYEDAVKPNGDKSVTTARHIRAAWEALS
jgi:hypothetical protein